MWSEFDKNKIEKSFTGIHWGAMSMVSLYISLISGLVVSLQYDPGQPYYSVSSLEILVPFGKFWRSLHFYASQLFFLLSVCHFLAILTDRSINISDMPLEKWLKMVLSLVVCLLLLFSGYILRADATGSSAGLIAENIVLTIPAFGSLLNSMLFSIVEEQMKRVYVNHLIGLCLLWLYLSWDHVRRYRISWRQHPLLVVAIILFCAWFKAPMEPENIGVFHISGPWFFVGLQEMLKYIKPFWAGIFWPLLFIVSLILLSSQKAMKKWAGYFAMFWLAVYAFFSILFFMH